MPLQQGYSYASATMPGGGNEKHHHRGITRRYQGLGHIAACTILDACSIHK